MMNDTTERSMHDMEIAREVCNLLFEGQGDLQETDFIYFASLRNPLVDAMILSSDDLPEQHYNEVLHRQLCDNDRAVAHYAMQEQPYLSSYMVLAKADTDGKHMESVLRMLLDEPVMWFSVYRQYYPASVGISDLKVPKFTPAQFDEAISSHLRSRSLPAVEAIVRATVGAGSYSFFELYNNHDASNLESNYKFFSMLIRETEDQEFLELMLRGLLAKGSAKDGFFSREMLVFELMCRDVSDECFLEAYSVLTSDKKRCDEFCLLWFDDDEVSGLHLELRVKAQVRLSTLLGYDLELPQSWRLKLVEAEVQELKDSF